MLFLLEKDKQNLNNRCKTLCAAAINHYRFCQTDKSYDSKVKFWQASNRCKRFLEALKLECAGKKESYTSLKFDCLDFCRIANCVLIKGKSAIPPLFNCPVVLSSPSNKTKLFPENFSKNSNLDDSGTVVKIREICIGS